MRRKKFTRQDKTREIKMLATSRVHRKPLQQKNQNTPTTTNSAQPKPKPKPKPCIVIEEVSLLSCNKDKDKENVHPFFFYSTNPPPPPPANSDRADEMRSEKMLRERGVVLDLEMEEMVKRGEVQKQLELEVDRLYRLKEIKLACMRVSRLRSLRDKEQEKKTN